MQKRFSNRVEVSFYLERADYEQLMKAAGLSSISALCRGMVQQWLRAPEHERALKFPEPLVGTPQLAKPDADHHPRCPCDICVKKRKGAR